EERGIDSVDAHVVVRSKPALAGVAGFVDDDLERRLCARDGARERHDRDAFAAEPLGKLALQLGELALERAPLVGLTVRDSDGVELEARRREFGDRKARLEQART